MKQSRILWACLFLLAFQSVWAQPTFTYTDPNRGIREVQELIAHGQYALAWPISRNLVQYYPDAEASGNRNVYEQCRLYYLICGLKLRHNYARTEADQFLQTITHEPYRQWLAFHLAQDAFEKQEYEKLIDYAESCSPEQLSNEQLTELKFQKAYACFHTGNMQEARTLLAELIQMPDHRYSLPAHYYYGIIAYRDKKYEEALRAFKKVEASPDYKGVAPYYITEIFYMQGKKEDALRYAESVLQQGSSPYYEKQLKLLAGQAYFEKGKYEKALPLLEYYVQNSEQVSREVHYELSYCYYAGKQTDKAIAGFRQLSNEKDSMGQNSMYLLAGLYLDAGDKPNARNAFQFSATNKSHPEQQRISRFNYAKLSYELGYPDIALREMRAYLTEYPNSDFDQEGKEILVNLLANSSNYSDALALYASVPKPGAALRTVYPRLLFGRAMDYLNDQRLPQADSLLQLILQQDEASLQIPYAHYWKGEIAYRQQQYDAAIRHMDQFMASGTKPLGEANVQTARYTLGYAWFQKEQYGRALSYFEKVAPAATAAREAIQQDAFVRVADCHFMLKDFSKATQLYQQVYNQAWPNADYALYQQAMIAGVKSSADKIKKLNSLAAQYPSSALVTESRMEAALTHISDEQFREALPYLEQIVKDPEAQGMHPRALLKTGLSYYNLQQNQKAIQAYQKLLAQYPNSAESAEATGILRDIFIEEGKPGDYFDLMKKNGITVSVPEADSISYASTQGAVLSGDCSKAIAALSTYIRDFPEGVHVLAALQQRGQCYLKQKEPLAALDDFNKVQARGNSPYYEQATLEAARILYFTKKDYAAARIAYAALMEKSSQEPVRLEALRGLVRCHYQLKDFTAAREAAETLLSKKGIHTDDKTIAALVLAKSQQVAGDCTAAISNFKSVAAMNKSAWGAEARYEWASCYFQLNNLAAAEKTAMMVIRETGSYDYWVTRSYILLGDIFMKQKDYFNAKATYESVYQNAGIAELKAEAGKKWEEAKEAEKKESNIIQ